MCLRNLEKERKKNEKFIAFSTRRPSRDLGDARSVLKKSLQRVTVQSQSVAVAAIAAAAGPEQDFGAPSKLRLRGPPYTRI